MLLIQPMDWDDDRPVGDPIVAADCVGAGAGEMVFFVAAREAIAAFEGWEGETSTKSNPPPIDAAVMGIIDGKNLTVK